MKTTLEKIKQEAASKYTLVSVCIYELRAPSTLTVKRIRGDCRKLAGSSTPKGYSRKIALVALSCFSRCHRLDMSSRVEELIVKK
jgi:hypothetical protein